MEKSKAEKVVFLKVSPLSNHDHSTVHSELLAP